MKKLVIVMILNHLVFNFDTVTGALSWKTRLTANETVELTKIKFFMHQSSFFL